MEAWNSGETKSPGTKMGSNVKGPQRTVRGTRVFGIPAGVSFCGKRFFPLESGAGPERTKEGVRGVLDKDCLCGVST